jgi:hypothetical protein
MKQTFPRKPKQIALGRLSRDTHGQGGVILEPSNFMPKTGITH